MRKRLTLYISLLILLIAVIAQAADFQPYAYPLIGKWQPSGQSLMADEYALQDVQNLRRDGNSWVGVKGHTKINTTLLSSYPYILNGFHFKKQQPAESHVLILAGDTAVPANSLVYENTTAIPTAGDFSATVWHTDAAGGMGTGRFSEAPNGHVVYSNGVETKIWGGNETRITAFYTGSAASTTTTTVITKPADYSEKLTNSSPTDTCTLTKYFFIGTTRPVSGFKFYVGTANTADSTTAATYWNGAEWTAVASAVDGTAAGGKSFAQTGSYTFTSTVATAKPRYINGLVLYWYQFTMTATTSTVIYQVTSIAPIQDLKNIWSGIFVKPAAFLSTKDGEWSDYTDEVIDGSSVTYANIDHDTETPTIMIGFVTPQQAIKFTIDPDNGDGEPFTVYYWNGAAWAAVTATNDGTATFNNTGVISWSAVAEGLEQMTVAQGDSVPLYYYKLVMTGDIAACHIREVRGIESAVTLKAYRFAETFQNRLFIFNEVNGRQNKLQYSAYNSPDIFNGTDSGFLYIGDDSPIIAAKPVFNIFKAGTYDQLIIGKANEIYRLSGDGPSTWSVARISANIGIVAPLSMVSAEVAEGMEEGVKRQVVVFQGSDGFYVTDGASVIPISADIRCYFDANDTRAIPSSRLAKTVAWYDPSLGVYKALISSGSAATYHNVELEFNLGTREWTKIYRVDGTGANPLQSGFQVFNTNGIPYTYGGNTKGNVYRLENGFTWDATAIAQYLWTKDFIPDKAAPLLRKSTIKDFRVMAKKQAGTMTVAHYGDGVATTSGTDNQVGIDSVNLLTAPYDSQSCALGPFLYHSFKFSNSASTNTGMELTGFGFWYEPYTAWR